MDEVIDCESTGSCGDDQGGRLVVSLLKLVLALDTELNLIVNCNFFWFSTVLMHDKFYNQIIDKSHFRYLGTDAVPVKPTDLKP